MISNIILKDIPGYHGYQISPDGQVYSEKRNQFISHAQNWAGYHVVTITDDSGFRAPRKVHRLVYLTYVGPLDPSKVVDHKDDNKDNNYYKNLQQITPSQNSTKSFVTGKNADKAVWTKQMISDICYGLSKNFTNREVFKRIGVDYDANRETCNHLIGSLINGKQHQDIAAMYNFSKRVSSLNKQDAKLTVGNVQCIYVRLKYGKERPSVLANYYNVTHSTICKIRDKKTWREITDKLDKIGK